MAEELVPPDFLISPSLFEETFITNPQSNLADLALDGRLNSIKNRFTAWRIFLGILPGSGPLEVWTTRITELRNKYQEVTESQRVIFI
jgi:hypothetical protein